MKNVKENARDLHYQLIDLGLPNDAPTNHKVRELILYHFKRNSENNITCKICHCVEENCEGKWGDHVFTPLYF